MKMKKTFDCVEMKRGVQAQVYGETRGLTRDQELEYFHEAAERFWAEIAALRQESSRNHPTSEPHIAQG